MNLGWGRVFCRFFTPKPPGKPRKGSTSMIWGLCFHILIILVVTWISTYTKPHAAAAAAESLQSCPALCDPIDSSPSGSPLPGILQARTLECVAISFSSAWKSKVKVKSESEVAQSCLTLSDPMDCSPPGSSIHGVFQARVLEWGAIAFSIKLHRSI